MQWNECFGPERLVAVDYATTGESEYFAAYRRTRGLGDRLLTRWGVDQGDRAVMHRIAEGELGGEIDLVIDDAWHQYLETRASFEILFPLLRPGGHYLIEDWTRGHWTDPRLSRDPRLVLAADTSGIDPPEYDGKPRLSRLVLELAIVTVRTWLIRELSICPGFVAVERGWLSRAEIAELDIDAFLDD